MANLKIFEHCKNAKYPMVVLDLFSGIGSAALCLKRVGIKMKTIISVDHDPLAHLVNKYNHRKDGILHVYKEKFEYILENVGDILSKYGREWLWFSTVIWPYSYCFTQPSAE